VILALVGVSLTGCGDDGAASSAQAPGGRTQAPRRVTLRLGYLPNITHAQALVGIAEGTFQQVLGDNVRLEAKTFNAGPAAVEALFAGEIDAAYIGPSPAINGFVKSEGKAIRIIAGAVSGGASLVVRQDSGIAGPSDLAGKKIASPQLGNTQDVALRAYLQSHGLKSKENGGNVTVLPTANPNILTLFRKGDIDGAWVPEPWATRLVVEAGGKVFLDERDLWPNGDFATTQLVVNPEFLARNPDAVARLLQAHVKVTQDINSNPEKAKEELNAAIKGIAGASLSREVIDAAWARQRITYDPIASTLRKSADDAFALGLLGRKKPDVRAIYDLKPLNGVLAGLNLAPVKE